MILSRILDHLAERRMASVVDIARTVDAAPDTVRGMLDTLQRRGLIHQIRSNSACGTSCRQCAQAGSELYGFGPAPVDQPAASPCSLPSRG